MNKIKMQFSQLRNTTPKYVQWLLLLAAFLVVIILFTLMMTGSKKAPVIEKESTAVKITVSDENIDWAATKVGQKKTQSIKITTTAPARIAVRRTKDIDGFKPLDTCNNIGEITPQFPCTITLEYAPTHEMPVQGVPLFIDWRGADMPESMNETIKITVVLGASEPEPAVIAEPVVEPVPAVIPEPKPEPQPAPTQIQREIEAIAPSYDEIFEPKPAAQKKKEVFQPQTQAEMTKEACSDFAFPGYDTSGNQIGWIKPEGGAYYFHPFSDKNCDTPTGVYNPDNGIITDIKNTGNKIGTDAEHIGYTMISAAAIPQLSNAPSSKRVNRAVQAPTPINSTGMARMSNDWTTLTQSIVSPAPQEDVIFGTTGDVVVATAPYDRTFILRQYKPIPATIVSDVRADTALAKDNLKFPVRATVDRNVYSDNGRTIIIPTGTLLMGYVSGDVPGPYKAIGRMNIKWYQFVLPNGVEFNFEIGDEPESADSQGRIGVPGRGSTDYMEQFVMPMLTAIVPAAVNMIAPVADKFVNQIDLDNNTVVQSGTLRSSELAKNEIITAWNQVAQKLMVDMMDNTVPPFTIPAGTRITVYAPTDLAVSCTDSTKKCYMEDLRSKANNKRTNPKWNATEADDDSWVGQVRSFNSQQYCTQDAQGLWTAQERCAQYGVCGNYSYRTLLLYCQSLNYQSKNNARQEQLFQNQQDASNKNSIASMGGVGSTQYNENVLGLQYADEDKTTIVNPFQTLPKEEAPAALTCMDGSNPDMNGCCAGEIYTDMGDQGFNCCPETGGDCFPPIL